MRKRSKYRKSEAILPVVFRFNADSERFLQLIPQDFLADLRDGRGTEGGWHSLAARLNMGMVLARDHFDAEAVAMMDAALDALTSVYNRHQAIKQWGTTGEEFFAMGNGLNLTDAMQIKCTRRELQDAINKILPSGGVVA